MPTWTQPLVNRFLQLFADPVERSYGEIANTLSREFNIAISKNAAIGIGKRLDVPQRKKAGAKRRPEIRLEHRHLPAPRAAYSKQKPVILGGRLRIDQLTHNSCRWPFGDHTPFLFCGAVQVDGQSYCAEHMKISCVKWQPTQT
jgi:hypothetical protein